MTNLKKVKIARISTVPYFVVTQLKSQVEHLASLDAKVFIVTSKGPELSSIKWNDSLRQILIDIPRSLHLIKDVFALLRLFYIFRKHKFDIIHSTTPKAGLLSAIAGALAGVPIRLHTFTGQPWIDLTGPIAWSARMADSVIGLLSTHCYADSQSQSAFLVSSKVIRSHQISVIGAGSLAGVDLSRFNSSRFSQIDKDALRASLTIDPEAHVVLFVGRIARDKGIFELLEAFHQVLNAGLNVELLLVGPLDQDQGGVGTVSMIDISGQPKIHHIGYTDSPEKYMAIADLLCLPSYREGFGTVVIEAAAMSIPTLGTKIYGLTDAVEDGVTGVLVPPRSIKELSGKMIKLLNSPDTLHRMGVAAQTRCENKFDAEIINRQVADEYVRFVTSL